MQCKMDVDDPFIEDLKRKSFTTSFTFSDTQACKVDFPKKFAQACRKTKTLLAFLNSAVGN